MTAPNWIARAVETLDGHRAGSTWLCHCPCHDDASPSLSLRECDGVPLAHCHAGCAQADVLDALRERGLWPNAEAQAPCGARSERARHVEPDPGALARTAAARAIWSASRPAPGTLVEAYLHSRSIALPVPPTIRFHAALKHGPSGLVLPAMVGVVQDVTGRIVGAHRTWLAHNGGGKATVAPTRMILGPIAGGAVRLAKAGATLAVAEGIETSLSFMLATGTPTWAALSAPGMRAVILPLGVRDVVLAADGDDAGEAAAQDAAHRFIREGRAVRIACPPRGLDFNDLVSAPEARGVAA